MRYQKTYLKQVILRLDYGRLTALLTEQETDFTRDMRARYPVVTATPMTQLSFFVAAGGVNFGQQGTGWQRVHKSEDAARSVTLTPDFLAIEYGADTYDCFDELREQVNFVLTAFQRYFGTSPFTRIGLRYVNEITLDEGSALDWDGLINPGLVTSVKAAMVRGLRMTRSIHQFIAIKDDISVILNYGINNPDFPSPVARRQFILDLDCYVSGVIDTAEAEQRIKDVNELAEKMFEHSIEDGLRSKMGIIE